MGLPKLQSNTIHAPSTKSTKLSPWMLHIQAVPTRKEDFGPWEPQRDVAACVPRGVKDMHLRSPKLVGLPILQRHINTRDASPAQP